jgi:hypothetical protein
MWGKKKFFALTFASALFFFAWFFPFNDLSGTVTSAIARLTANQVYAQFETLDLHLLPQPALSASGIDIETSLPPLHVQWAKVTPNLFSTLFALPALFKAAGGDPSALASRLSATIAAEGLLGGDVELRLGPGRKSEQGHERSRVSLAVDKLSLSEVQKWSDLSAKISGQASLSTDIQISPDLQEQPDGEYDIRLAKFAVPASTIMVPMGEANLPVNIPPITLADVVLRGRLTAGNLVIEEGHFGQAKDPIYGRIKGQIGLRFQALGSNIMPMFGSYNLTVELTTTPLIEKDLGFAFLPLNSAKTTTTAGGGHYLFRAMGQGIGMAFVPNITRVNSF